MNGTLYVYPTATGAWLRLLDRALASDAGASPRGLATREVLHSSVAFDMNEPALICEARRPSYKFMAGEALWILSGSNRLAEIAPYNRAMARFSDDGETLAGAYGPRIVRQIPYVINALAKDLATRQAVIMIFEPSPSPSKDVPCTLALTFNVRGGQLNCHALMRSSDIWLGVPYDFFTFSMVATTVLYRARSAWPEIFRPIGLGALYLTAVSSHLYAEHLEAAREASRTTDVRVASSLRTYVEREAYDAVLRELLAARDANRLPFSR